MVAATMTPPGRGPGRQRGPAPRRPGHRRAASMSGTAATRLARQVRMATVLGRFVSRLASEHYLGSPRTRPARPSAARGTRQPAWPDRQARPAAGDGPGGAAGRLRGRADRTPVPGATDGPGLRQPPHAAELRDRSQDRFRSFERTAAAAASLGQVHRAVGRAAERSPASCNTPTWRVPSRRIWAVST